MTVDEQSGHWQPVVLLGFERSGEQGGQDADGLPVRAMLIGVQGLPLDLRVQGDHLRGVPGEVVSGQHRMGVEGGDGQRSG